MGPVLRNPKRFQLLPLREYMRKELPPPGDGFIPEDLDLVLRHYGPKYNLDADGRFMLIEQKHPGNSLGTAQIRTFSLIHRVLRNGDPERAIYAGYYLLNIAFLDTPICEHCARHLPPETKSEWTPIFPVLVNGQKLDEIEFKGWLNGSIVIPSMFD